MCKRADRFDERHGRTCSAPLVEWQACEGVAGGTWVRVGGQVGADGGVHGVGDAPSPGPRRAQREAQRALAAQVDAARAKPPRHARLAPPHTPHSLCMFVPGLPRLHLSATPGRYTLCGRRIPGYRGCLRTMSTVGLFRRLACATRRDTSAACGGARGGSVCASAGARPAAHAAAAAAGEVEGGPPAVGARDQVPVLPRRVQPLQRGRQPRRAGAQELGVLIRQRSASFVSLRKYLTIMLSAYQRVWMSKVSPLSQETGWCMWAAAASRECAKQPGWEPGRRHCRMAHDGDAVDGRGRQLLQQRAAAGRGRRAAAADAARAARQRGVRRRAAKVGSSATAPPPDAASCAAAPPFWKGTPPSPAGRRQAATARASRMLTGSARSRGATSGVSCAYTSAGDSALWAQAAGHTSGTTSNFALVREVHNCSGNATPGSFARLGHTALAKQQGCPLWTHVWRHQTRL